MALFGTAKTDAKKPAVKKDGKTEKTAKPEKAEASMQELYASENAEKKAVGGKKTAGVSRYEGAFRVLIKPLITEKATDLGADNKYAFFVAPTANKIEVAKAIYAVYGVKPIGVNIISSKGKAVTRGRIRGQRKDRKKAIVTLKKGETIKVYEGV